MKDGYNQVPLIKEERHITCMCTPRGTKQWTVLAMGLKNTSAIFQMMMEWFVRDLPGVNVGIEDVVVGSKKYTLEDLLANHCRDEEAERSCPPQLFVEEVEFCGHFMRDG